MNEQKFPQTFTGESATGLVPDARRSKMVLEILTGRFLERHKKTVVLNQEQVRKKAEARSFVHA